LFPPHDVENFCPWSAARALLGDQDSRCGSLTGKRTRMKKTGLDHRRRLQKLAAHPHRPGVGIDAVVGEVDDPGCELALGSLDSPISMGSFCRIEA
jgi:hypothetical protein